MAAEESGLKNEADRLLAQYLEDQDNGIHFSQADPIKYEAIIVYAIEQGKMQGEDRMYYINQGIGSGFIPFDRGAVLTSLNNTYPPIDRYDASTVRGNRPTIDDVKEWACHDKVTNIYDVFETLSDNPSAKQRAVKTISQGQNRVDHDDAPMLAGHIDAETLQGILGRNGQGGYGLPATGIQSLVVGHELWLDVYAHRHASISKEVNDAELSRFVTMFMRFDGITGRQMFEDRNNWWRLPNNADTEPPRAEGSYNKLFGHEILRDKQKKPNSITGYINSVKDYLEILDFDPNFALIKKLNQKEFKSAHDIRTFIQAFELKYPGTKIFVGVDISETGTKSKMMNALYETAVPAYINFITKSPEHAGRVTQMVQAINADHEKIWQAQDEARRAEEASGHKPSEANKSLRYRLDQVAIKQNKIRKHSYRKAEGHLDDEHGHGGHGAAHGAHGDDHDGHAEEKVHHRTKGWSDEEDNKVERKWESSRRDHGSQVGRTTWDF